MQFPKQFLLRKKSLKELKLTIKKSFKKNLFNRYNKGSFLKTYYLPIDFLILPIDFYKVLDSYLNFEISFSYLFNNELLITQKHFYWSQEPPNISSL